MPGNYRNLLVWQLADGLFFEIDALSKTFPEHQRYGLTAQLRRAALSVPSNIVEGTSRFNPRETLQFLRTSWGSLSETEYLLSVARRLEYLSSERHSQLEERIARTGGALRALARSVERRGRTR